MNSESLREKIKFFPEMPGVYQFLDKKNIPLYIGKASCLKKRISYYTRDDSLPARLRQMVFHADNIVFTVTLSETDALLLESKLIKEFLPKYNILLKDDKDYSYLIITTEDQFPRILKTRERSLGKYFKLGPFVSQSTLYNLIRHLNRIYKLRTCSNTVFKTRTRPCLEYFLKNCSAPCTNLIAQKEYNNLVSEVCSLLTQGPSAQYLENLHTKMSEASLAQAYEKAAVIRDLIQSLSAISERIPILHNSHILILESIEGISILKLFFFQKSINYGSKDFFFSSEDQSEILEAFLSQFYGDIAVPQNIIINLRLDSAKKFAMLLNTQILCAPHSNDELDKFICKCSQTAIAELKLHIDKSKTEIGHFTNLASIFNLSRIPQHIEILDNSHFFGKNAFACIVVYSNGKFQRKNYRAYKFPDINSQDDCLMLRKAIEKRFLKSARPRPDLLIVDGGIAQFNSAIKALESMNINIDVIAISKGANRNAYNETFFSKSIQNFKFPKGDKTLFFIERLRDEAHNFAISRSRRNFTKTVINSSILKSEGFSNELIKNLYAHFKDLKFINNTSKGELLKIKGMNYTLVNKLLSSLRKYYGT